MPQYTYKCSKCGVVFEDINTIANREQTDCSCGGLANRDLGIELERIGDRKKWVTDNERWSLSMGVPQASLDEYRKAYPNSVYDDRGRLLIRNRKDKLRQAAERGFVELD